MENNYEIIIKALIALIFAIWTGVLLPLIKSKLDETNWKKLEKYAEFGVRTAEQIFTDNKIKRDFVINYLTEKTKGLNMNISDQDISNIVEYTVNLVKYGQEYTRE